MKNDITIKKYYTYVAIFLLLNILVTFVVTTEFLNHYIVSFNYSFLGIINSIIGNLTFLLLIIFIINLTTKNLRKRMIMLIITSFLLGGFLFWAHTFSRFYGTSFTFKAFQIFKNPAGNFGLTIFFEALREMITYFRIVLFIPFVALLLILIFSKSKQMFKNYNIQFKLKHLITSFLVIILLSSLNITIFTKQAHGQVIIESAKPTYATQNLGIYSYLLYDIVGFDYNVKESTVNEVKDSLDIFNTNKDKYINVINNNIYTKSVKKADAVNLSGQLVDNYEAETLTGILEDYNLVLVHLETFNYFLLEYANTNQYLWNFKAIIDESYTFNNFYTTVGLGNSFDAEVSVLTGLYANGTSTLAWDFDELLEKKNFNFNSLPKLFNEANYETNSFHGNSGEFYNRDNVHPKLFGFNNFHSKEVMLENTNLTIEEIVKAYDHDAGVWLSDRFTLDYFNNQTTNNQGKYMNFLITMLPHTPFHYDPYYPNPKETDMYSEEEIKELDILTLKYFNYLKYYNEIMEKFIIDENGNLIQRPKTAYIFYGDHGSSIKYSDVNYLYNNELDSAEIRQKLLQTISFIYVPGTNIVTKEIDGHSIKMYEGIFKGEQNLVRDQIDLYRTIIDLFNLPIKESDFTYGVHGLSNEPAYALDNKSLNVITDDYITNLRNDKVYAFNNQIELNQVIKMKNAIIDFKKYSDLALNDNLYEKF